MVLGFRVLRASGVIFSNCLGDHVIAVLGCSGESAFGYLRQGGFSLFLHPLSTPCLFLINTHMLCLLLVDLGPLPLPRQE